MRDEKGRWLPGYTPQSEAEDDGRHILTPRDRRKGYEVATRYSKLPSRVKAWLRNKIRRRYSSPSDE